MRSNQIFDTLELGTCKRIISIGGYDDGALVDYCRGKGVEAYGCEVTSVEELNRHTYYRNFERIHFPTDYFDRIICSVFDAIADKKLFFSEASRTLTTGGRLQFILNALDNSRYGIDVKVSAQSIGLQFISVMQCNQTFTLYSFEKPNRKRTRFLLPPGIGDVYWPLVKIQSLMKRDGIVAPVDTYIAAPKAKVYDSHKRAFPFLKMFPFLHSMDKVCFNKSDPTWKEAYLKQGRTIFKNVQGCDYFITWNGHLRAGKTLEEIDPDLECNWILPRFISLREEQYKEGCIEKYGNYLILFWGFMGSNANVFKHFSIQQIAFAINRITERTYLKPILIGAKWDRDDAELNKLSSLISGVTDVRGETSIEEVFGMIRGAKAVVGINSGITIMSAVFGVKTILLYHQYFFTGGVDRSFAWNTFPPETRNKTYFPLFTDQVSVKGFAEKAISVINDTEFDEKSGYGLPEDIDGARVETTPSAIVSIRDLEDSPVLKVICVLKSGGSYKPVHVSRLNNMVKRNLTFPFEFIAMSDMKLGDDIKVIKLSRNLPGWWSKLEIFKISGPAVYVDLDTLVTGDLNCLAESVMNFKDGEFNMLIPFNPIRKKRHEWASGVMAWKGDFSYLLDSFDENMTAKYLGDQDYIAHELKKRGQPISPINDSVNVVSFKRECKAGPPDGAQIVCFHGKKCKPHLVSDNWVKECWV